MKRFGSTVFKNAIANLIRGGASAVVALALPHFLVRALDTERFAAWALILQIAAYASYLDFGLQTAVARFLAQAIELKQYEQQNKLVSTALALLTGAGGLAVLVVAIVLWQLPHLFHGVPAPLTREFRFATFLLASTACLSLPLSAFTGVLIGLHKNEYPALAIGSSRLIGAGAAILVSHYTQSLTALAACIGIMNIFGGVAQIFVVKNLLPNLRIELTNTQRAVAKELLHYCFGLTIWSLGMFLVSGLDVSIVGHFQFSSVGYYAVASLAVNFIAGLNASVFAALMTPLAALHAKKHMDSIARIVLWGTRINTYTNVVIAFLCVLVGHSFLKLWVGEQYAQQAFPILLVLAFAQAVRLSISGYSIMLIATGQQSMGIAPSMLEASINVILSVVLAARIGPIGVAWGTLFGAVAGVLWVVFRTMHRTYAEVPLRRKDFLFRGMLTPLLVASPLAMCLPLVHKFPTHTIFVTLFGILISLSFAKRAGYLQQSWREEVSL